MESKQIIEELKPKVGKQMILSQGLMTSSIDEIVKKPELDTKIFETLDNLDLDLIESTIDTIYRHFFEKNGNNNSLYDYIVHENTFALTEVWASLESNGIDIRKIRSLNSLDLSACTSYLYSDFWNKFHEFYTESSELRLKDMRQKHYEDLFTKVDIEKIKLKLTGLSPQTKYEINTALDFIEARIGYMQTMTQLENFYLISLDTKYEDFDNNLLGRKINLLFKSLLIYTSINCLEALIYTFERNPSINRNIKNFGSAVERVIEKKDSINIVLQVFIKIIAVVNESTKLGLSSDKSVLINSVVELQTVLDSLNSSKTEFNHKWYIEIIRTYINLSCFSDVEFLKDGYLELLSYKHVDTSKVADIEYITNSIDSLFIQEIEHWFRIYAFKKGLHGKRSFHKYIETVKKGDLLELLVKAKKWLVKVNAKILNPEYKSLTKNTSLDKPQELLSCLQQISALPLISLNICKDDPQKNQDIMFDYIFQNLDKYSDIYESLTQPDNRSSLQDETPPTLVQPEVQCVGSEEYVGLDKTSEKQRMVNEIQSFINDFRNQGVIIIDDQMSGKKDSVYMKMSLNELNYLLNFLQITKKVYSINYKSKSFSSVVGAMLGGINNPDLQRNLNNGELVLTHKLCRPVNGRLSEMDYNMNEPNLHLNLSNSPIVRINMDVDDNGKLRIWIGDSGSH